MNQSPIAMQDHCCNFHRSSWHLAAHLSTKSFKPWSRNLFPSKDAVQWGLLVFRISGATSRLELENLPKKIKHLTTPSPSCPFRNQGAQVSSCQAIPLSCTESMATPSKLQVCKLQSGTVIRETEAKHTALVLCVLSAPLWEVSRRTPECSIHSGSNIRCKFQRCAICQHVLLELLELGVALLSAPSHPRLLQRITSALRWIWTDALRVCMALRHFHVQHFQQLCHAMPCIWNCLQPGLSCVCVFSPRNCRSWWAELRFKASRDTSRYRWNRRNRNVFCPKVCGLIVFSPCFTLTFCFTSVSPCFTSVFVSPFQCVLVVQISASTAGLGSSFPHFSMIEALQGTDFRTFTWLISHSQLQTGLNGQKKGNTWETYVLIQPLNASLGNSHDPMVKHWWTGDAGPPFRIPSKLQTSQSPIQKILLLDQFWTVNWEKNTHVNLDHPLKPCEFMILWKMVQREIR